MVLNPFFTQGTTGEQNLVQDLINEQLKMYGVDIFYLPRKYLTTNTVIKEVVQSKFDVAYPLEAYVDNYDEHSGGPNLLTKFGIQSQDEVRLIISRERFENYINPLIANQTDIKLSTRPKTGDLIWFPLDDRIYEIKDVEWQKPYYMLQDLYTYILYCELFRYEDEVIDTGIDEIDNELTGDDVDGTTEDGISTIQGPTQTLTMVGTGVSAAAYTNVVLQGGLRLITLSNRGGGYSENPTVAISSAPTTNNVNPYQTGIATVTTIGGIAYCNKNVNSKLVSIQSVPITNPGAGYTAGPGIQFLGGGEDGAGAAATSFTGDGTLGIVSFTNFGSGFTTDPTVTISAPGAGGTTATAVASINNAGIVTFFGWTNAGAGYTSSDTVNITFSDPSFTSSGTFLFNEVVTGGTSGTTARVRTWNGSTNILEVASVDGTFTLGETLTGGTSGASRVLRLRDLDPDNVEFADNYNIETEADDILDFSEQNPFGTP
tara:strand:- start:340 stop:1803 length:1464 start_codon:yes stop_codon:yes gene_type:complete